MAKKQPAPLSPRQIRRQQQREAAVLNPAPGLATSPPFDPLGPSVMVPLFCSVVIIGYQFYAHGYATRAGNELSNHLSLFTAINAATLTGFQQLRNPDDYTVFGQVLTFLLTVAGMLFSFICGGIAVVRIAKLPISNLRVVTWAFGSIVLTAIGGGLAIKAGGGDAAAHRTFFDDAFQAVSAFGNSGLTVGALPDVDSLPAIMVYLPLAILGGFGLPVLMDVFDQLTGRGKSSERRMSDHSRTVLIWSAGSYVVITVILLLVRWPGIHASGSFWRSAFVQASGQAINARSAGFAFKSCSNLLSPISFLIIGVMVIGASPGGSAGGVKLTTLAMLTRGTRDALAGRVPNRAFAAALIWLAFYAAILIAATVALLIAEPEIHLDRCLFLTSSALGNVGLSQDSVTAGTPGLYVLSATMMLGRVAPIMMLWYMVDTMPEAEVAVG